MFPSAWDHWSQDKSHAEDCMLRKVGGNCVNLINNLNFVWFACDQSERENMKLIHFVFWSGGIKKNRMNKLRYNSYALKLCLKVVLGVSRLRPTTGSNNWSFTFLMSCFSLLFCLSPHLSLVCLSFINRFFLFIWKTIHYILLVIHIRI